MLALEITLFIIAYTSLIISLAFGLLCYKRKVESIETVALNLSLLLLVISISVSPLFKKTGANQISELLTLSAMVIVGCTTWLNTLSERKHRLSKGFKNLPLTLGIILIPLIIALYLLENRQYAQWLSTGFLLFAILSSVIISRLTAPLTHGLKWINLDRVAFLAMIIVIPLYLFLLFGMQKDVEQIPIGFLLPLLFTLLAVANILENIDRLSGLNVKPLPNTPKSLTNYGLTDRESEVAQLLSKGCSYSSIAEQLFISIPTVKTHTGNIYKKCNVKSKYELIQLLTPR